MRSKNLDPGFSITKCPTTAGDLSPSLKKRKENKIKKEQTTPKKKNNTCGPELPCLDVLGLFS
jgi:hypothetical protein